MSCGCNNTTTNTDYIVANKTPLIDGLIDKCSGRPLHPITDTDAVETKYSKTLTEVLDELINQGGSGITGKYVKDVAYNDGTITITYSDLSKTTYQISAALTEDDVTALKNLLAKDLITDIEAGNNITIDRPSTGKIYINANAKRVKAGRGLTEYTENSNEITIGMPQTYFEKFITDDDVATVDPGYYMKQGSFLFLVGDTNFNGKVDVSDLTTLNLYILDKAEGTNKQIISGEGSSWVTLKQRETEIASMNKTTAPIKLYFSEDVTNVAGIQFLVVVEDGLYIVDESLSTPNFPAGKYNTNIVNAGDNIYNIAITQKNPSAVIDFSDTDLVISFDLDYSSDSGYGEKKVVIQEVVLATCVDENNVITIINCNLNTTEAKIKVTSPLGTSSSIPKYSPGTYTNSKAVKTLTDELIEELNEIAEYLNVSLKMLDIFFDVVCDINNSGTVDATDLAAMIDIILNDKKEYRTVSCGSGSKLRTLVYIDENHKEAAVQMIEGFPYINKEDGSIWTYFESTNWISNTIVLK